MAVLFFFFGFLTALIIFGFNTPLLPNFQVLYSISGSWPEFLTSIGTLLAVIVALFGDQLRSKILPSDIRIVDKWQNVQNNQGQTRLLFRNIGKSSAHEVEIYLNKIVDNNVTRQGFLPVPLIWTHTPGTETKRDLHPKQFGYYLDICRVDNIADTTTNPKIPLIFGAGVEKYEMIHHGQTTLELAVSQKSGELITYDVGLEWIRGEDKFVRVVKFTKS